MIFLIQLGVITLALSMIYFALLHYRRKEINSLEIGSWFVIWVLAIVVIVFPDLLRSFSQTFLFARLFDLVVTGVLLLVVVMVAKSYITTRKLEKKMEELVRKESLRDLQKLPKKSRKNSK